DTDSIANAVSHLVRTSLLTRHTATDSERYSLSSSVRELLLRFPKSSEVRARVNARMREQRALISTLGTTADVNTSDPLAWNFVHASVDDNTKAVLIKTCRRLRGTRPSHEELIDLFDSIQKALDLDPNHAILFRAAGHILFRLNDRTGAIDA